MSCFMGYNPLVAKEVKITTWIKEFDGDSPVYPSFPNEGDCFVVFATDEDALTHNALSKKTYTNGDWADAEGGGGGGGEYPTFTWVDVGGVGTFTCDKTFAECKALCDSGVVEGSTYCVADYGSDYLVLGTIIINNEAGTELYAYFMLEEQGLTYSSDGTITIS